MKKNEMQLRVQAWVMQPQFSVKYFPPFEILAQLVEETGEIARELSDLHGHKKKKEGEITDGLACEIGDVLFVLCCLANSHDINLDDAFEKSIDKKYKRDQERFVKK
jgi:NTP pyrophosphatase (non-canonical NTP hydrolase)